MAAAIVIVSVLAAVGVFQLSATTSFESVATRDAMVSFIGDLSNLRLPVQCDPEDREHRC